MRKVALRPPNTADPICGVGQSPVKKQVKMPKVYPRLIKDRGRRTLKIHVNVAVLWKAK